ncbi:MAG: 16S rRNA (cytosine(1402)-N(4))-methyltransferase RsmH [Proteobacteria bacterium]|nr:16S rRNA (cytosine(1402)-N(4))-methyltransferase RsmH [Pseudomonadota bacterium]
MHSARLAHNPVLLQEMLTALAPKNGGIYVDGTFGAGGYSSAILASCQCSVIAIDQDKSVQKYADELTKQYPKLFQLIHGNFADIGVLIKQTGCHSVDGVVLDIGVSSMQIDTAERGFSFMKDGPLDMRMNQTNSGITAASLIANTEEEELANILYLYGGERKSRQIAKAIVNARKQTPITSTIQLATIVSGAVRSYRDAIHPATRTFQALRIVVNAELTALEKGLKEAIAFLAPLGRLVVVTFHSLEDSIVKRYFASLCGTKSRVNKYKATDVHVSAYRLLNKSVISPDRQEVLTNPRARSAKLRAIERLL